MKTYIRNNIKDYYIEFPEEIDAEYWEGQIGTDYQDFLDGKWVLLSDEQVDFHVNHLYANIKEVLDMELTPRTIEEAQQEKLTQISDYDTSDAVNSFDVLLPGAETPVSAWFDQTTRANYKGSIDAAETLGIETMHVPFGGQVISLPTQTAKTYLAKIQIYANACAMVTESHKAAVMELESINAVDSYDHTAGYPPRLVFDLNEDAA